MLGGRFRFVFRKYEQRPDVLNRRIDEITEEILRRRRTNHEPVLEERYPAFHGLEAFPEMIKGAMIADAIAIIGSLNVIAGELDR